DVVCEEPSESKQFVATTARPRLFERIGELDDSPWKSAGAEQRRCSEAPVHRIAVRHEGVERIGAIVLEIDVMADFLGFVTVLRADNIGLNGKIFEPREILDEQILER